MVLQEDTLERTSVRQRLWQLMKIPGAVHDDKMSLTREALAADNMQIAMQIIAEAEQFVDRDTARRAFQKSLLSPARSSRPIASPSTPQPHAHAHLGVGVPSLSFITQTDDCGEGGGAGSNFEPARPSTARPSQPISTSIYLLTESGADTQGQRPSTARPYHATLPTADAFHRATARTGPNDEEAMPPPLQRVLARREAQDPLCALQHIYCQHTEAHTHDHTPTHDITHMAHTACARGVSSAGTVTSSTCLSEELGEGFSARTFELENGELGLASRTCKDLACDNASKMSDDKGIYIYGYIEILK